MAVPTLVTRADIEAAVAHGNVGIDTLTTAVLECDDIPNKWTFLKHAVEDSFFPKLMSSMGGVQTRAAEKGGLNRATLRVKLKRMGIM